MFVISFCFILTGVTYNVYSLNNSISVNDKIIGKIAREIEIPNGSDYYVKFISENYSLEGENITPYSSGLSEKIKNAIFQWVPFVKIVTDKDGQKELRGWGSSFIQSIWTKHGRFK